MEFVLYYGIILLVISLILLIKPAWMMRLNKASERVVFTDSNLFSHPFLSGVVFILLGCLLIYIGYMLQGVPI